MLRAIDVSERMRRALRSADRRETWAVAGALVSAAGVGIYGLVAEGIVTDSAVIIALPVPGKGGLVGLYTPNPAAAQRLFAYLMEVATGGARVNGQHTIDDHAG